MSLETTSTLEVTAVTGFVRSWRDRAARATARAHGTPVYVWKRGKVVAEKP